MLWIMLLVVILGWGGGGMLVGRSLKREGVVVECGGALVAASRRDRPRVEVHGRRSRCLESRGFQLGLLSKDDMDGTGRYTEHRRYAR